MYPIATAATIANDWKDRGLWLWVFFPRKGIVSSSERAYVESESSVSLLRYDIVLRIKCRIVDAAAMLFQLTML